MDIDAMDMQPCLIQRACALTDLGALEPVPLGYLGIPVPLKYILAEDLALCCDMEKGLGAQTTQVIATAPGAHRACGKSSVRVACGCHITLSRGFSTMGQVSHGPRATTNL